MLESRTVRLGAAVFAMVGAATLLACDDNPLGIEPGTWIADFDGVNGYNTGGGAAFTARRIRGETGQDALIEVEVHALFIEDEMEHPVNIHFGSRCPTEADDDNGDGWVDGVEGMDAYGQILVPLDDNATLHEEGQGIYPESDDDGELDYAQDLPLTPFMEDLRAPDPNPDDDIVKLGGDGDFDPEDRTYVVFGISDAITLPETVQALDAPGMETPHQSIPIGCGQLVEDEILPYVSPS